MGRMADRLNAATTKAYDKRDRLQAIAARTGNPETVAAAARADDEGYLLDRQAQLAERAGR